VTFDFDLIFEILKAEGNEEEGQPKKTALKGIKFERGE
jgi:hypothetical protein